MRLKVFVLAVLTAVAAALFPVGAAIASGPSAALNLYSDPTTSGQQVLVYAWNSCCNITNYQFDFGDGSSVGQTSSYSYHTYTNYGTTQISYTVRLTVTDNTGATSTTSATEYVNPDYAPVAHLTVSSNTSDTSGLSIYADASGSTDADVDGATPPYLFQFGFGDGTSGSVYNTGIIAHKYAVAGTYTVSVLVYDTAYNSNAQSTASVAVSVPTACGATCASQPNPPAETRVKFVVPSTVSLAGAFPIQVAVIPAASSPVSICNYQIDRGMNGTWTTIAVQHGTTFTTSPLTPGSGLYQYRTWSDGCTGSQSSIATPSIAFHPLIDDQSAYAYAGSWALTNDSTAYGGSYEKTTTIGASVTFIGTLNTIGIVAQESRAGGKISIYVDGVLRGTANLYSSTVKERQVVFRWGWPLPVSSHTVKVVLTGPGSGGGKTLALDALVALGG